MNDMFIGDSDFVEIAQRRKSHQELEKQTRLLEETRRVESARLTEVKYQTKILKEQVLLHKEAEAKAEEDRKYLKSRRKILVNLAAMLNEMSHNAIPIHSEITSNDLDLYETIISSKWQLEMIEKEDRLEAIEDIKFLEETIALVNKLINQDYAEFISFVSGVIEATKKYKISVKKRAQKLIDKLERIKNNVHDDATLISARNEIDALEGYYKEITNGKADINIQKFIQLYSDNLNIYKIIEEKHRVNIKELIHLSDWGNIVKNVFAINHISADFFSCTYKELEQSDVQILSMVNDNLNMKTLAGVEKAKELFALLFFQYEDSNDIYSLIESCENAIQNGSRYLQKARNTIKNLLQKTDKCLLNSWPFDHYKIQRECSSLQIQLVQVRHEFELAAKLNVVESIEADQYLSSVQYAELHAQITLLDEKLNRLVKISNKPFLIRHWWIIFIPPSVAFWIYVLSAGS